MAMGLDESINWVMTHWYYWALIIITVVLLNLYMQLKRLREMYTHWTETRLKDKAKTESKINPPSKVHHWILKEINPIGTKYKRIGKITSFKTLPHNPDENQVTLTANTRLIPYTKISLGGKKIFRFGLEKVKMDEQKKSIIIPYNYYWQEHPSGEYVLMCPKAHETWKVIDKEIDRDLKRFAIDGFASQMASYSAVRPTWGHEADIVKREQESKFGFLEKFKGKKKKEGEE